MEPIPTAKTPKIPRSQQEVQETVLLYLQKTVDGLPPGTVLDSSDARGGGNLACDDNYMGPGPGPTEYSVATHVIAPAGMKPTDMVMKVGDVWRGWGLTVLQRTGFEEPNQFGYPDDGYRVQIAAAYPPKYPPLLTVISPCFPGDLVRNDIPVPKKIEQTQPGR